MKKVSVVVAVYNVGNYLEKCLKSLVTQSLTDIEILVINDGSTDNSEQIGMFYAANYPEKVKLINKSNGGLSDARNIGIAHATGKYIGFVDGDDSVAPKMFETLFHLAEKHQAEISLCSLLRVNNKGKVIQKQAQLLGYPESIDLIEDTSPLGEISCYAANKIFKRDLFVDVLFPKDRHFEDVFTIPILFFKAKRLAKTDAFLYHYLDRAEGITRNFNEKGLDLLQATDLIYRYMEEKRLFPKHKKAFKRFFILQGYFSFLAYWARVPSLELRKKMRFELKKRIKLYQIRRYDIFNYKRNQKNYLFNLNFKKKVFYLLSLTNIKWLEKIIPW